ncbi:hypothetical protein D3C85_1620210 [compost metagenome]
MVRFALKISTRSAGKSRVGPWSPRMTGRLNDGFRALNSSSGISASLAAISRSMSLFFCTVTK